MISIKHISKTFYQKNKAFKALDDINLEVAQGDIVGIIGSSGAGKSTLIRCVNLLEKPDDGSVSVNGIELTTLDEKRLAAVRKKIGMIFQHFNLLASRTVFQNIAFPLELDAVDKTVIRQKVNALLDIVGLTDKADAYPSSLSGGQKQRVAIARALANDPYVLLCDEATSALDPATTQSILQLLQGINHRLKITILLITHEMDVVKAICNHVAVLAHGRLAVKGKLEELIRANNSPELKQFMAMDAVAIPPAIYQNLQDRFSDGLSTLIEVELNGTIAFDQLTAGVSGQHRVAYNIIKADVEYIGHANFGRLLLQLLGTPDDTANAVAYLNDNNLKYTIRGYV